MPIRLRLGLLLSVALVIIMSLALYASNTQHALHQNFSKIQSDASNLIHLTEQLDNNFQKQLLSWTNLLLRGQNSTQYHHYLSAFYQQERITRNTIKSLLKNLAQYQTANQIAIKFQQAHNKLGIRFRRGLTIFNNSDKPAYATDQFIWNSSRTPIDLLTQIKSHIKAQQETQLKKIEGQFQDKQNILVIISLSLLFTIALFFTWLLDVYIGQPIAITTRVAKKITQDDYSHRITQKLPGEFNLYANAFNSMMEHIAKSNIDLMNYMKDLENEIFTRKTLEQELQNEKLIAENASKSKSEFLSTMSHELRTPLNIVTGYIELLNLTELNEKQANYIQSIQSASASLLSIINDVLDFAKIESGKLTVENDPVPISDLLLEIESMFTLPAEQKNLRLSIIKSSSVPDRIISDFARIKQILVNLLSNAIKFTDNGEITLTIDTIQGTDNSTLDLLFTVEDTGIGIADNFQEKLFLQFEQQDGQDTRKYGGSGLGLAISKKLSNLLNGDLTVSSQLNKGSIFTLRLFKIKKAEQNLADKNEETTDFSVLPTATILIADDIKQNRNLIIDTLHKHPIFFIQAENGKQAITLAAEHVPDLILMDIKMPEMDGITATKIIKDDDKLKHIPVIAISASSVMKESTELKNTLFDDYLNKPIKLKSLLEKLKYYLNP